MFPCINLRLCTNLLHNKLGDKESLQSVKSIWMSMAYFKNHLTRVQVQHLNLFLGSDNRWNAVVTSNGNGKEFSLWLVPTYCFFESCDWIAFFRQVFFFFYSFIILVIISSYTRLKINDFFVLYYDSTCFLYFTETNNCSSFKLTKLRNQ